MAEYLFTGALRASVNERIAGASARGSSPKRVWFAALEAADTYDLDPTPAKGAALQDAANEAGLAAHLSLRFCCFQCGSDKPHLHPAVQHEGEVSFCSDPFHLVPTPENTPDKRAELLSSLAKVTCNTPSTDLGTVAWKCFWCNKVVQVVVQFVTRDGGKWAPAPSGWLFVLDGSEETHVCSKACLDELYSKERLTAEGKDT